MLVAVLDDVDHLLAVRRNARVFTHQLRITQDAVKRRAQLMADGADVAAFGLVGLVGGVTRGLRHLAGLLQGVVGDAVGVDFTLQRTGLFIEQVDLPVRLFLGDLPAFLREYQPPGHQPGNQQQRQVDLQKPGAQG